MVGMDSGIIVCFGQARRVMFEVDVDDSLHTCVQVLTLDYARGGCGCDLALEADLEMIID